jgi:hypothetical protein
MRPSCNEFNDVALRNWPPYRRQPAPHLLHYTNTFSRFTYQAQKMTTQTLDPYSNLTQFT